jgi:hypothetical protein
MKKSINLLFAICSCNPLSICRIMHTSTRPLAVWFFNQIQMFFFSNLVLIIMTYTRFFVIVTACKMRCSDVYIGLLIYIHIPGFSN